MTLTMVFESVVLKFAYDTKLIGKVKTQKDRNIIKRDLIKLHQWSKDWQMPFHIDKCKILHFGRNNERAKFELGGKELKEEEEEKDLGVIISEKGSVEAQFC